MNESSALLPTKQHLFQCCGNGSIKICTERMGVRRPPSLSPLWTHRFTSKLGKLVCSEDKRCWHCSHNLVYLTDIRHNASNRADERTLLAFFAVATGSQQRSVNESATPGSAQPMPPESTTTNRRTPNQPTTDQPTRISPQRISPQRINPLGSFLWFGDRAISTLRHSSPSIIHLFCYRGVAAVTWSYDGRNVHRTSSIMTAPSCSLLPPQRQHATLCVCCLRAPLLRIRHDYACRSYPDPSSVSFDPRFVLYMRSPRPSRWTPRVGACTFPPLDATMHDANVSLLRAPLVSGPQPLRAVCRPLRYK